MYDEELIDYNSMESSWDIEYRNYMLKKFNITENQWFKFWDIELVAGSFPYLLPGAREEYDKIGILLELEEAILKERDQYIKDNPPPSKATRPLYSPNVVVPF